MSKTILHISLSSLIAGIATILPLKAQDSVSVRDNSDCNFHLVAKGETWSIIANRYELSEEAIKLFNPLITNLHTGIKLALPPGTSTPLYASEIKDRIISSRWEAKALEALQDGYYSKAIKLCDKAIHYHSNTQIYYIRGMAHSAQQKWRQASNDYQSAMELCDDEEIKSLIEFLYYDAKARHDAWWEEKLSLWSNIGIATLQVGIQSLNTYLAVETASNPQNSSISYYNGTNGSALNLQFPSSLDFSRYTFNEPLFEYNFDEYGNYYSTANGLANMLERMNADFNREMYAMTSQLTMNGDYHNASSIMMQLQTTNWTSQLTNAYMRLPKYGSLETMSYASMDEGGTSYSLQEEYNSLSKTAEMWGKAIESHGIGYDDKNGEHHSAMDVKDGTTAYASGVMRQALRNTQKEMAKIRAEAKRNGIEIAQNRWEVSGSSVY